jgi:hypothetical protein
VPVFHLQGDSSVRLCNFQKFCLSALAALCQKTENLVSIKNVSDIRIVRGWSEIKAFILIFYKRDIKLVIFPQK